MKNYLLASYGYKYPNGDLYEEVTYSFTDKVSNVNKTCKTRYFFLGIEKLLNITFDKICLFLTEKSRKAYESDIKNNINEERLKIINIPDGKSIEEVWRQFDEIVSEGESYSEINIYLDITNGFRHLPLVLYNSLFYLESLGKINLCGIYYGALEAVSRGETVPVFDLTHLAKIMRGSFAVRQFEETGNILGLKDFANDAITINSSENPDCPARNKVNLDFEELQELISAGLPIEAGINAKKFCDYKYVDSGINTINKLIERIVDKVSKIAASKSGREKKKIELNEKELDRTLDFIKGQIEARNISNALVVLREWVISRILFTKGLKDNWLEHKTRDNIEKQLGYWNANREKLKNTQYFELLSEFNTLGDRRNEYAHAGYREKKVDLKTGRDSAQKFLELCIAQKSNDEFWKLPEKLPGNGSVLVTPMGASSGLLYSAVSLVNVDKIIVLTSEKFIPKVNEACSKAGLAKNHRQAQFSQSLDTCWNNTENSAQTKSSEEDITSVTSNAL